MSEAALSVKLTCQSWQQLSAIYSRDLSRGAFFLKTQKPPPKGTAVRISLTLPSDSTIELRGKIHEFVGQGGLNGRGPGVDIILDDIGNSVMWLIESALASAGLSTKAATPPPPAEENRIEEGGAWVEAEGDLVKSLWEELNTMSKLNSFQRLNLSYEATDSDVRTAFGSLSKKYHPDRFARYQSFEIRELANEVFILLRDSYREIGKEVHRIAVLARINPQNRPTAETPPVSPKPPPVPPAAAKPPAPAAARLPAAAKATPSAPKPPEPAPARHVSTPSIAGANPVALPTRLAPESFSPDPTISAQVGIGLRVLESGQYEQALRILRVELRKAPKDIAARVGVELAEGRLALASGDRMEAAQRFEVALEIDPSNEWAAREIAEMRRHVTSQRRGLLSKLMKKV